MTPPLVYEADREAFLDRARRITTHLGLLTTRGVSLDVEAWGRQLHAIQEEVAPIPLVVGVRYRIRTLAGPPTTEHHHYDTDRGIVGLDIPVARDLEYLELEGRFVGRRRMAGGGAAPMLMFDIGGGQAAGLTDSDILRCEEVRS